jgi:hypothetical protein
MDVQVNLGLPAGFSGGPVLIEVQRRTFCLGISTLGGEDRPMSRIRLGDCIVGFLQESGLEVEMKDADEVFKTDKTFKAREVDPRLAQQPANIVGPVKPDHFWRWAASLALLVVAAFAGFYHSLKPALNQPAIAPHPTPVPAVTVLPSYQVKIALYSSNTPPQLFINKKQAILNAYDGRTATLLLHPGNYRVEANYDSVDKICTAIISVPRDLSTEAECHLK